MFEKLAERLNKKSAENEIKFKSFTETVAEDVEKSAQTEQSTDVISKPAANANIELKVTRPEKFEDVSAIADFLLDGCTVVLNMELMEKAPGLRMLDFLNGVTYSLGGDIKNVSPATYIITPHNVDIS